MLMTSRLVYKFQKYTAIGAMVAKWNSRSPQESTAYKYVTLGGTELRDVRLVNWINGPRNVEVVSYELSRDRWALAQESAQLLSSAGLKIEVRQDDLFSYRRDCDAPHVFFVDLLGACHPMPYRKYFKTWFEHGVLCPGDFVMITSYLGRNAGWPRTLKPFDSEFRVLGIADSDAKKKAYQSVHPLFVLYGALCDAGLDAEFNIECLGHIRYKDSSTMGLHGISVTEGMTDFRDLVQRFPMLRINTPNWT